MADWVVNCAFIYDVFIDMLMYGKDCCAYLVLHFNSLKVYKGTSVCAPCVYLL